MAPTTIVTSRVGDNAERDLAIDAVAIRAALSFADFGGRPTRAIGL